MNVDPSGHFAKLFKNIGSTLQTAKKVVSNTISAVKTITSNVVKVTKNVVNNFTSTVKQVFNNSYSKTSSSNNYSNTSSYRTTASESSFNAAKTSTKNTTSIVQSQAKPVISTRNSPLEIVRKNIETLKNACEGAAEIASKAYKYKDQILDVVQIGLDIAGMAPAVGNVLDGVNGVISLARGNKGDAALNFASMIPFAGLAAGAGKLVNKGSKAVDLIKVADNAASIAKASDNVTDTISAAKKGTKVADSGLIMDLQLFGRKNADEVVEKIAKNSDEGTKAVKNAVNGTSNTKVAIKQNEVTTYKDFVDRSVVGDNLEGHELWQHANLKANDLATNRLSTEASKNNQVIALDREKHKIINKAQRELDATNQLPIDNIISNSKILRDKGIPEDIVDDITNRALNHMKNILK